MRKLTTLVLAALALCSAAVGAFAQTLPANTVWGRLGIGPGPAQAIPFATLYSAFLSAGVVTPVTNGGTNCSVASGTCLDNIAGFGQTGIMARIGVGAYGFRTLSSVGSGLAITNGDGVLGNPSVGLANDLLAIEALAGTGFATRTGVETWAQRLLAGTANEITATNGDGISGNPTLSLPAALTFTGKTVTGGTFNNAVIGAATPTTGTFTTVQANTSVNAGANVAADALLTGNANTAATVALTQPVQSHMIGADGANMGSGFDAFGGVPLSTTRRANGTLASKTGVVAADILFGQVAMAWDTAAYATGGNIQYRATETWGASAHGALIAMRTVLNGTTSIFDGVTFQGGAGTFGLNGTAGGSTVLNGATSGAATVKVNAVAGTTNFQLPVGNGSSGQLLSTDGAGNTSWLTASGTGTVTSVAQDAQASVKLSVNPCTATCTVSAGSGNRVLIATLTANNTSGNLDSSSAVSSTYDDYEFVIENLVPATNAVDAKVQYNIGGVQATNYAYTIMVNTNGSVGSTSSDSTTGIFITGSNHITNSAVGISGTLKLYGANSAIAGKILQGATIYIQSTTTHIETAIPAGYYTGGAGAITDVRFNVSAGNWVSGTVKIYGIVK